MTDRELLELAAKAAGYEYRWQGDNLIVVFKYGYDGAASKYGPWNPLINIEDRYRLMQKMKISIDFQDCYAWRRLPDHTLIQEFWGGEHGDEAHAVLLVAAEIGREMI